MTPTQLVYHQQHKFRQQRIEEAARLFRAQKLAQEKAKKADLLRQQNKSVPALRPSTKLWFSIEGDAPIPTIENIQHVVAEHFGVTRGEILSPRREAKIVKPRHIAYYLSKKLTRQPLTVIGRHFGGRDHTTILLCVRKISARLTEDEELRAVVDSIEAKFMVTA